MGADCLLKLVCQHLVLARVPNLNAECIFLEEFARDQQLLQGKEGYALVIMQATLGFLNASQNLVENVFIDDDWCARNTHAFDEPALVAVEERGMMSIAASVYLH